MKETEFFTRVDSIRERLCRIAYGYFGGERPAIDAVVVDAVDEAVYKAYRARGRLREDAFFETWLTRILINVCLKELRRNKREISVETLPEMEGEQYDSLPLKEAIRRLPEDLRSVIILRYFADLTLTETAERLNIPQGTAATRQRRALSLLKLELKEESV